MSIPDAIVDREMLDLGIEDTTGLYAVVWRLNTLYPADDIATKYAAADQRVRALLQAGHIRLVRQFVRQNWRVELISEADAGELLKTPTAWYPSDLSADAVQIGYETTDSGAQLYEQLGDQPRIEHG